MAESETVNIDGTEFDIETLEEVLDKVEDGSGNIQGGIAAIDGIVVAGDSGNDSFVRIARVEDVDIDPVVSDTYDLVGDYTYTSNVRSKIADAQEKVFTAYLADIDDLGGDNEFGTAVEAPVSLGSADAYAAYRFLSGDEMQAIVDDDGTRIAKTKADGDETVYVGVEDVRDQ